MRDKTTTKLNRLDLKKKLSSKYLRLYNLLCNSFFKKVQIIHVNRQGLPVNTK